MIQPAKKCMKTALIPPNDRPAEEISTPQPPRMKIYNDCTVCGYIYIYIYARALYEFSSFKF